MNNLQRQNNKSLQVSKVMSPFLSIQREVDKALNDFYTILEPKHFMQDFENLMLSPSMDLAEDDNEYKLEVEMPGMDEKDIKISINDNLLTIRGEKTTSKKNEQKNYISREINYGQYERTMSLPQAADGDKATASFKKGMLCITLPKKAESKGSGREIKVEKAS